MDFFDFPATQVCVKNDDFEPTQNIVNNDIEDKKQVGVLVVNDTEYPIYTGSNTIGRHASNNIVLKDSTVSKHHAEIEGRRKVSFICDLKSCNTTVLNKEKLLPNRLFELSDGASLRIGSIAAIYRKLSTLNESILKTPAAPRCNEIIAGTPDSVLNITDDDPSIIYGTQKNSAGPSEFRRPSPPPQGLEINRRNLSLEFFSNDSLFNTETESTSIYEQETETCLQSRKDDFSGIHDLGTEEISFNNPETSNQKLSETSDEFLAADKQAVLLKSKSEAENLYTNDAQIHEADTQAVSLNSKCIDSENLYTGDDIILEANTQVVPVNLNPQIEHLNQDCKMDDADIFDHSTQQVSAKSDKIHEEATQAFTVKTPVFHSNKLKKSCLRTDYSDLVKEIFEEALDSTMSDNIHEEATQAITLESPNTSRSARFQNLNKSDTRIDNSDTDEEGVFEEATQKVPANRKIYEEATQACAVKSPIETGNLGRSSIIEDSDTDEDGIFESSTQKYTSSSSKKIHEEATQDFVMNVNSPILSSEVAKADSKVNDSDTDEEKIFEKSTQAVSLKISVSKSNLSLKSNLKSNKAIISVEVDSNKTADEANFNKPTQKDSPKSNEIENLNISKSKSKIATSLRVDSSLNVLSTNDERSFKGFEGQKAQILIKSLQKKNSNFQELKEKVEEELSSPLAEISTKADLKLPEDSEADDKSTFQKDLEEKQAFQKEKIIESTNSEPESNDSKSGSKNTKPEIESSTPNSKTAEDSETDDEGIFQKEQSNSKELEKFKSKCPTQSEKISVSRDSEAISDSFRKADSKSTEVSETKDEKSKSKDLEVKKFITPVQKKMLPEAKNSMCEVETFAKAESKTGDEDIFQKENSNVKKFKGKKQLKTPTQKEKINESKIDPEIIEESETDDEGIFEKVESNTPIQKEKMPENPKSEVKNSAKADSKSSENSKSNRKISAKNSETVEDSETDNEGVFEVQISKPKILNRTRTPIQKEKSPILKRKISPKPSTGKEQNQEENPPLESEIDHEAPTQVISFPSSNHEGNSRGQISKPKILNGKNQSKTPIQIDKSPILKRKISPKPSTSKEQNQKEYSLLESEFDHEAPTQVISFPSSNHEGNSQDQISKPKIFNGKNQSKTSVQKSPVQKGKLSPKPSTSKKRNQKENSPQKSEIDYEAPTQILAFPSPNHEEVLQEQNSKSNILNRKKTYIQKENPPKENEIDDETFTQVISSPSSERRSFGSKNASIEDLDYEMAPTQSLEDLEASKMKTSKNKTPGSKASGNKSNSGNKPNSGRRSTRRSNPKLHDTIEENLNEMFEGEGEEIGEPSQMLTQQLENILEESQASEELLLTPSTSRTRTARRIETSSVKMSPLLTKRSSRSKNSTQVGKFNFKVKPKPSSGLQISASIKSETCKPSDESDEDFVPFLPKNLSIKSNINLEDGSSLKGALKCPGSPAPSTSSELSIDEGLLKSSPNLTNNRKGREGRKFLGRNKLEVKKSKGLNSIGNFHILEEVEKLPRSTNYEVDSDSDAEFEELKHIADRVLKTKSVYVQNKNSLISNDAKATMDLEKVVESPSVFQVDADNRSPRMSKLNIIRRKKERKVESPAQKNDQKMKNLKDNTEDTHPLKKRPLKMSEEEPETSTEERGKRLKMGDTEEIDISTLLARRSIPFKNSPKVNKKAKVEEKTEEVKEPKKNLNLKTKEVKGKDLISSASASINDSFEGTRRRGRPPKIQTLTSDEVGSSIKRKAIKRTASSSFVESAEIPTSTTENLKVPLKAKKTKKTKKENPIENEENEENEEDVKKTSKARKAIKRKIDQSKEIISNSSSSSSLVDSSSNEAKNSMTENLKKTAPKKMVTRGKKKEVSDTESMRVDNSSASSSMVSLYETSGDGNSSAASTPTRSNRSRMTSSLKHKVLFTGISADNYQKSLSQLGLTVTEDGNKSTVLVTDKVRRTLKFLRAISQGIPIVSINWLVDSSKRRKIQELENYIVKDAAAEAKFGFTLAESLKKAREKKMLEGVTIVLTPNIKVPPLSELKEMVISSGGKAIMRCPLKWPENTVVVSDEKDSQNAKKFMAKAPKTVTLQSTEFLLTGILKQEVDLKSFLLKIE